MKSTAVIVFSAISLVLLLLPEDGVCTDQASLDAFAERIGLLEKQLESGFTLIKNQLNKKGSSTTVHPNPKAISSSPSILAPATTFTGIPAGCNDLLQIGYIHNGFYPVQNQKKLDLLFCNFTDSAMKDTRIGSINIKTSGIHFHARRNIVLTNPRLNNTSTAPAITIPFPIEMLNIGNALNVTSGVFTAPKAGIYHFTFTGLKAGREGETAIFLQLNGSNIAASHGEGRPGWYTMSLESIVKLKVGDRVYLVLTEGTLYDDGQQYSTFTGDLMEEDLNILM